MKYVKIGLSLAFFVLAFTLFGLSGWHGDWYGGVVGGLVFSGQVKGRCMIPSRSWSRSERKGLSPAIKRS